MKISLMADLFRSEECSIIDHGNSINIKWLNGLLHNITGYLNIELNEIKPKSNNGSIDIAKYLIDNNLPGTKETWAIMACKQIEDNSVFDEILKAEYIIGWGLTHPMMDFLNRKHIKFISVEIHPIRFMNDIYFTLKTNDIDVKEYLKKCHLLNQSKINHSVAQLHGYFARRDISMFNNDITLGVFVGQTQLDLSIVKNRKISKPIDYIDQIKQYSQEVDILLVKPHPYCTNNDHLSFFKDIKNAKLCQSNIYRILSDHRLNKTISISSSVLVEAQWLMQYNPKKEIIRLINQEQTNPIEDNDLLIRSIIAMGNFGYMVSADQFINEDLIKHIKYSNNTNLNVSENASNMNLRQSLGSGWAMDDLYKQNSAKLLWETYE
jgi:hypothetical protein